MQFSRSLILGEIDEERRTVEASLSSEQPVYRAGLGDEVLAHTPEAVDLSRAPFPLITAHDHQTIPVGIVEGVRLVGNKLRGTLRFGNSERASELWADVKSGIVRNLSIGYQIIDYVQDGSTFNVTRWQPYETSIVAIPADATVGIGRSFSNGENQMNTNTETTENQSRSQRIAEGRALSNERERVADITGLGDIHAKRGGKELAEAAVSSGMSVDAFRSTLMDHLYNTQRNQETVTVNLPRSSSRGYGSRDISEYSLVKAVSAAASGDWSKAGLEREIGEEEARATGRAARGILVPVSALVSRTMQTATASAGGALVPTQHMGFIEMLRPYSRVLELGATVLPGLVGSVELPKQTTSSAAEWLAEDDAITGGDLGFDTILLNPKTVGSMTTWTRRMMLQSVPGIEDIARRDLATVIALAVDRAALHGAGSGNQPTGLYAASSVNSIAMGGVPTYGKVVDMVGAVAEQNGLIGNLGWLTTPGMAAKLAQTLRASAADADMIWEGAMGEGELAGYKSYATNQVRSDLGAGSEHGMIFGNWSELVIGQWGGAVDLLIDPYTYADRGRIRLTAFSDMDIAVRHPESFCKATGATV
ncbi:MAG: phage major capsid protein [Gammaproteobacteria bacterium]|nr:phage major capsid protein [Gammaproteobacteria bacterium]